MFVKRDEPVCFSSKIPLHIKTPFAVKPCNKTHDFAAKSAYQTVGRGTRLGRYATSSSHAPTTSSRSAGKKFGPIRLMWMMDRYRI